MPSNSTGCVFMTEPSGFGFNEETASSNVFQQQQENLDSAHTRIKALEEFHHMADVLRSHDVQVIVGKTGSGLTLPDAVFPNNWVSFLPGGQVVIFPMMSPVRRLEKSMTMVNQAAAESGYRIRRLTDMSYFEQEGKFLEGTGSMVLDHISKKAYACLSPRTHEDVLKEFCRQTGYEPVVFQAYNPSRIPIYHTNVILTLATGLAVICAECITDPIEQSGILHQLNRDQFRIIQLTFKQVEAFAGNMLEIQNRKGESLLIMSRSALKSLTKGQLMELGKQHQLVPVPVPVIEKTGGGSVRCMMAEVFNGNY